MSLFNAVQQQVLSVCWPAKEPSLGSALRNRGALRSAPESALQAAPPA